METSLLERIDVAEPCSVAWDSMARTADDRVRFCGACRLEVWNFADTSRADAEALVRSRLGSGGSLCARFARRSDGTVVTDDCGPARRAIRRRAARVRGMAAGLLGLFFPLAACAPSARTEVAPARPAPEPIATPAPIRAPDAAPAAVPAPVPIRASTPAPSGNGLPPTCPAAVPGATPKPAPAAEKPPAPNPAPAPEPKPASDPSPAPDPKPEPLTGKIVLRPGTRTSAA